MSTPLRVAQSSRTIFRCSEASQSTTKVTKRSATTAGQLPFGTGREFLVDQREFSAPAFGRTSPTCRLQSEVPSNSDLERHSVAVQETEQWVGLCLVPVRFRTYQQLEALTQVPSPQAQLSLISLVVVQHQVPTIQTVQKSEEVSQCQHLDRYRRARREAETGPDQPENPEDGREDTGPSAQRHVPIIRSSRCFLRHHKLSMLIIQKSRRLLRHHRNSCGRFRGSSSSRRRLSTRQVLVIQSPEDRVCPTGTGHGHDRRSWSWSSISQCRYNTKYRQS